MTTATPAAEPTYDGVPAVLLIADGAMARAGEAARLAGFRARRAVPVAAGAALLDEDRGGEPVLAWFDDDLSPDDETLLDRLTARAGEATVVVPRAAIDPAYARLAGSGVTLLADAATIDVAVALAARATPPRGSVAENGGEGESARLADLTQEVARIARRLAALAGQGEPDPAPPPPARPIGAAAIRALIRARRRREQLFGADLFGDPVWDMMLDLAAAAREGRRVAVSSLCIAAAVPPTTALRWLQALTAAGLFVRHPDPDDRRRIFIGLSDDAAARIDACLAEGLRAVLES